MLVRANKPKAIYRATEIATAHGHLLYYTPPYHPELQPIELIWVNIKGHVAEEPADNMAELRLRIEAGFNRLTSDTWTDAYKHAQQYEQKYLALADQCMLASDNDDESEADDDEEDSE
jgi:hypothetical protein